MEARLIPVPTKARDYIEQMLSSLTDFLEKKAQDEATRALSLLLAPNTLKDIKPTQTQTLVDLLHQTAQLQLEAKTAPNIIEEQYQRVVKPGSNITSPLYLLSYEQQIPFYLTQGDLFARYGHDKEAMQAHQDAESFYKNIKTKENDDEKETFSSAQKKCWGLQLVFAIDFALKNRLPSVTAIEDLGFLTAQLQAIRPLLNQLLIFQCDDLFARAYDKVLQPYHTHYLSLCEDKLHQANCDLQRYTTVFETIKPLAMQWQAHQRYPLAIECYNAVIMNAQKASVTFESGWVRAQYLLCQEAKEAKERPPIVFEEKSIPIVMLARQWQKAHTVLQRALQEKKSISELIAAQQAFSKNIKAVLSEVSKACVTIVGPPPTAFVVLATGSLTRDALTPLSDIDIACLVADETARTHPYFVSLWSLINKTLAALGGKDLQIETGDLSHFPTEDKAHCLQPGDLLDTPRGMFKRFHPNQLPATAEACALQRAICLYASEAPEEKKIDKEQKYAEKPETSAELFVNYQDLLQKALTLDTRQALARSYFAMHYREWQSTQRYDELHPSQLQIKERYLSPLLFWILDWGLYTGIFQKSGQGLENDIDIILTALQLKTKIHPTLELLLRYSYHLLQGRRLLAHAAFIHARCDQPGLERDNLVRLTTDEKGHKETALDVTLREAEHLKGIDLFLLIPLHKANKIMLDNKAEGAWQPLVPLWFTETESDKKRIEQCLDFLLQAKLVGDLCQQAYQQLIDVTWKKNDKPSQAQCRHLIHYFYNRLKKRLEKDPASSHPFLQILGNMPLPDGTRYWQQEAETRWQQGLEKDLFIADDQKGRIETETLRYGGLNLPLLWLKSGDGQCRLLKAEIAADLVSQTGEFKPRTAELKGRRRVIAYVPYSEKIPRYYFKILPELAGMEQAIHDLSQGIMGKGTANTAYHVLTIKGTDNQPHPKHPRPYPILISEAIQQAPDVKGQQLEEALLDNTPAVQKTLSRYSFTQWVLLSLLTYPEDGTPHNFVITLLDGRHHLIGIDNDHHFVQALLTGWFPDRAFKEAVAEHKEEVPADDHATRYLQIKTIIYCLDLMNEQLDPRAQKEFLALDLFSLLERWLLKLMAWDKQHKVLLKEEKEDHEKFYLKAPADQFSFARPVFRAKMMEKLYQTAGRIKRVLSDHKRPVTSHLDLLSRVHPLVGRRYRPLLMRFDLSPMQRFTQLTAEFKKLVKNPESSIPSLHTSSELFLYQDEEEKSLMAQIDEKTVDYPEQAFNKWQQFIEEKGLLTQRQQDVRAGKLSSSAIAACLQTELVLPEHRAELVGEIDFSKMKIGPRQQQETLSLLFEGEYEKLVCKFVTALNAAQWEKLILKSPNLHTLSLEGCLGIDTAFLTKLAQRCPMLVKLILKGTPITDVGIRFSWQPLSFPKLRLLDVSACPRLKSIALHAPALNTLRAEDCKQLTAIQLVDQGVKKIALKGSRVLKKLDFTRSGSAWARDWDVSVLSFEVQASWFYTALAALFTCSHYQSVNPEEARYWLSRYLEGQSENNSSTLSLLQRKKLILSYAYGWTGLSQKQRLQMLLEKNDITFPLIESMSPAQFLGQVFLYYARQGDSDFLKIMLQLFPEENLWQQRDRDGNTAIHPAFSFKGPQERKAILNFALEAKQLNVHEEWQQAEIKAQANKTTEPKEKEIKPLAAWRGGFFTRSQENILYNLYSLKIEELLLHVVVGGEQDKAEAILTEHPVLALRYGSVRDKSERKFNNITAFQYAVWALDWHMWEMMLRQFHNQEHWTLGAEQYEELKKKGTEHGKAFSLQPLIHALQIYHDRYAGWSEQQREKHWGKEVGRLQQQLPWHVVNEYCRPDRSFSPCPDFTETKQLPRGKGRKMEWLTILRDNTDFAWFRGSMPTPTINNPERLHTIENHNDILYDYRALASLSKVRTQQQEELGQKVKKIAALKAKRLVLS